MERNTETQEGADFVRVIEVDPARLEKVVINNPAGSVFIVGTGTSQVRLKGQSTDGQPFVPSVEVKHDGRRIEISGQAQNDWNFQMWVDRQPADPDLNDDEDDDDEDDERDRHEESRRSFRREYRQQARRERRFRRDFDPTQVGEFVGEFAQNMSRWFIHSSAELYVEVPWNVELEVKTLSGPVEVRDMRGFCRLTSTSGAISLRNLTGGLSLKNLSGRLEAAELAGPVAIRIVSGKIDLWDCHMSSLDLSSTSGHIMIETDLGGSTEGDYKLTSTSGHVALKLPASAPVSVDCRTLSGRLSLPQTVRASDMRNRPGQSQARFDLNGGGRRLSVNTISGHIDLALFGPGEKRTRQAPVESWPATPPMPPVPPDAPPVPPTPSRGFVPPVPPTPPAPDFAPPPYIAPLWPAPVAETPAPQPDSEPARPVEVAAAPPDKKTSQLEILEALEQGKISVEEGLARLNALENN